MGSEGLGHRPCPVRQDVERRLHHPRRASRQDPGRLHWHPPRQPLGRSYLCQGAQRSPDVVEAHHHPLRRLPPLLATSTPTVSPSFPPTLHRRRGTSSVVTRTSASTPRVPTTLSGPTRTRPLATSASVLRARTRFLN